VLEKSWGVPELLALEGAIVPLEMELDVQTSHALLKLALLTKHFNKVDRVLYPSFH